MVNASVAVLDRGNIKCDPNTLIEGYQLATDQEPEPVLQRTETAVYNLLIDHPEGTILWDTGSHPEAGNGYWPDHLYEEATHYNADTRTLDVALGEVGYTIGDIDAVIMSHLHLDHAGGLHHFAGTDVPVYVHQEELKYAFYSANTSEGSGSYVAADFDHDLNWQIIHGETARPFEDIEVVHLPGHTPGMVGLIAHLDDWGTLIATSDLAYLPPNYEDERPLGAGLLWDRVSWKESLRKVKDLERRYNAAVVLYGHDPRQVERYSDGWP